MEHPLVKTGAFDLLPFADRWFHWKEINTCFWPGAGNRSTRVNPVLAPVGDQGGIYLMAHAQRRPRQLHPSHHSVKYVGETYWFKARMGSFGLSAGFWGKPQNGHSAAWRWKLGKDDLWVAFFPIGQDASEQPHLRAGLRKWYEALAIEEYRRSQGAIPLVNQRQRKIDSEL